MIRVLVTGCAGFIRVKGAPASLGLLGKKRKIAMAVGDPTSLCGCFIWRSSKQ
jgi:hypothetical protein